MLRCWWIAVLALAMMGCGKTSPPPAKNAEPAMKPAPPTPIDQQKEELGGSTWDPVWDVVVEKALPPELLSGQAARAVGRYCPNFEQASEADKRAFWAYFFQALAGAEAGLTPTVVAQHADPAVARKDAVSKRPVRQEGLLQLTYEDARRYGCDFDYQQDRTLTEKDPKRTILQPEKNLTCGVRIMTNQIAAKGEPLISRTSYWSTLRPGTASYRVFAKQMANVPQACKEQRSEQR